MKDASNGLHVSEFNQIYVIGIMSNFLKLEI